MAIMPSEVPEKELTPFPDLTFNTDGTALRLNEFFGDGQAKSRTGLTCFRGAKIAIKDLRLVA